MGIGHEVNRSNPGKAGKTQAFHRCKIPILGGKSFF